MPFKISKALLPKLTTETLCAMKNNSVVLKKYNQSNMKQFSMCTVRLRHQDKIAGFAVPGDGPVLLGMSDSKILGILEVTCEVVGDQQAERKI